MTAAQGLNQFLAGSFMLACAAVGLFYLRYWRRSGERLFAILGLSFWLLTVERIILVQVPPEYEGRHLVFLVRLLAFVLILVGVIDKNRARGRSSRGSSDLEPPPPSRPRRAS